jgi:hypothetical protein
LSNAATVTTWSRSPTTTVAGKFIALFAAGFARFLVWRNQNRLQRRVKSPQLRQLPLLPLHLRDERLPWDAGPYFPTNPWLC